MAGDGSSAPTLLRVLGPVSATAVVVGSVIGSGIFYKANVVAQSVGRFDLVILVWVVCGLMSLLGALSLAELAAMLPHAGGQYVYLREAYGPLTGFLWGWGEFWIMRTASAAALSWAFSKAFFTASWPILEGAGATLAETGDGVVLHWGGYQLPLVWVYRLLAISAVSGLTWVNVIGSRWGGATQNVTTFAKGAVLLGLMVLPFATGGASATNYATTYTRPLNYSLLAGFGAAMTAVFWAYDGWNNVAMVAEEIQRPQRNIPRALIAGMLILIGLYVGVTISYHSVLTMTELAETRENTFVAANVCTRLLGKYGAAIASAAVMLSTFGALNSNILTGPRVIFAMARDNLFPRIVARIHPRYLTPHVAIISESIWAVALIAGSHLLTRVSVPTWVASLPAAIREPLTISIQSMASKEIFDVLTDYVVFAQYFFFVLSAAAVFVLRARQPGLERPYKTTGYPILPGLFVLSASGFLLNMLLTSPVESLIGLAFIGLGVIAFQFRPSSARARTSSPSGRSECT